ncbi:uncharacterized protein N7477_000003 [Penicillium maclennaniae]|uniref:uncharacterized protein n=1 Tax=Penicillium maclennaniae TaxID=1343394 RepID=UPI0025420E43|nr:uncharacterized protein N7477_000003 [Penicillium maclennaniae]KAJ5683658.1 hypothetical protein N7477_000003 [Penicillium maclennaniae]
MNEMRFINDTVVVDRTHRTPLLVLRAGLPRCTTSSIQAALESQHIGLAPCMHFAHIAPNADRGDILLAALRENDKAHRHKLLNELFDGFQASTDFPGSMLMDDLMDMYPDAKIVLNKRPGGGHRWSSLSRCSPGEALLSTTLIMERCQSKLGLTADELLTAKHYDAHNAWIHAEAAKRGRDVLEFEPQDGWETLCAFWARGTNRRAVSRRNDASEVRMIKRILGIAEVP